MPAVLGVNKGLFLNRPAISVPEGALQAGHNFRIKNGELSNLNLGWSPFGTFTLGRKVAGTFTASPITLIYNHVDRTSAQQVVLGTPTDLYLYVDEDTVAYLTPIEATGTVDVSADTPAVVTENSGTSDWATIGIKAGDAISFGAADETDPDADWYEIASVDDEDTLTLTTAVTGGALVASTFTIRRVFTGDIDNQWEAVTFLHEADNDDDLTFFTNGLDDIYTWEGSDDQVSSAGLGFKAFHLAIHKNVLLAMAITDESAQFQSAQVRSSVPGQPLDFTNGLASVFTIHDGADDVQAALLLGDSIAFYSQRHIIIGDFVGDPLVYVFRTAVSNLGPLSGKLVGDFGDVHSFLGPDAQYSFDGVTVEETGNQVWREVLRQRDPTRTNRSWSHFDEENGDLIWAIPQTSDTGTDGPEIAFVEHYLEDVRGIEAPISSRAMPFVCTGFYERQTTLRFSDILDTWEELNFRWNDVFFSAAFPFSLAGTADGTLFTLNTSQLANGELLPSFVRFKRIALGDGRMRGLLRRVYPFASKFSTGDLLINTRYADSANGPITLIDQQTFDQDLPEEGHFVSVFRRGRFVELEIESLGTAWELAGYDFDIGPGGRR